MRKITFGRTGLEVSVMGLGGGGPSRLGRTSEKSQEESEAVVREAVAGGINIFDSSESYGTEAILGAVLKDVPRDEVVICTKIHGGTKGRLKTPEEVEASLDRSLANLQTDHLDVYMLHAVAPHRYDVVVPELLPVLKRMKEKGKRSRKLNLKLQRERNRKRKDVRVPCSSCPTSSLRTTKWSL